MQLRDELSRLEGISDVILFGQRDYSIRIWVDPGKLAARNMTAGDVAAAIRDQNAQVATGMIGNPPTTDDQNFQITLSTLGRLTTVEQFEDIILKTGDNGRMVRMKDIGRVELGAKNQDVDVMFDGHESVFLAVFQLPEANALETYDRALAKMDELSKGFPDGIKWEVAFDQTPYTRESIREVFNALRDAVILVAVVVLVFLQNWRSSIIPLVAVPVAIIGTFAAMAVFGFSLNNLTLFGLVLAIGIVVDDAIVVVEAVEHHIEEGLEPREATIRAMQQVSGPVIAVGLVLSAVFVPCAFISGITGQFFRQFALTISVSTIISAFNSLTLSPALTAVLLRPKSREAHSPPLPWPAFSLLGGWLAWELLTPRLMQLVDPQTGLATALPWLVAGVGAIAGTLVAVPLNWLLAGCFHVFNAAFEMTAGGYTWVVGKLLHVTAIVLLVYGGLLVLTYHEFAETPKGFIPSQDMGYLFVNVQLPNAASTERTAKVLRKLEKIAGDTPGVLHVSGITGQSFALNAIGPNFGTMFVNLEPYHERLDPDKSSMAILGKLATEFNKIADARVQIFPPPPIRGVGRAGGFAMVVEDRGDAGPAALQEQAENLMRAAGDEPDLAGVFTVFETKVPMLKVEPDMRAAMEKGVNLRDFAETLQIYQGSRYVNDVNLYGRTWQVIIQSEQQYRDQVEDLPKLKVRNSSGSMVPLGSFASIGRINGPLVLPRYNMYTGATLQGAGKAGVSSRDAIDIMERLAKRELPKSMAFEWTEMAFLELNAGNTAMIIFALAVVMVFLVLAAQYESWSLPLAIILVVPMCLLSAIIGVNLAKMDINIFTQIGFVVLVGLASKNAILIVEFAKQKRESGEPRRQAILEACRLRLRPIVMTSFAFILGVVPLMMAHGAGAEMRQTLGTAVFSGMLGVTLFGIFLTPIFFNAIDWLGGTRLFASHTMQFFRKITLDTLTLKPVRQLGRRLRQDRPTKPERRPQQPVPPEPALHD
jgi:multidrug efflux pump